MEQTMKRVLFALLAAAALAVAVTVPASASAPLRPFYLEKNCEVFFTTGNTCVVTYSEVTAIPAGSIIAYNGPVFNGHVLSMEVVIDTEEGTTTGHCTWALAVRSSGTCTFARGTGSLAGFHANLNVSPGGGYVFIWDGMYQL
jgi:hypothetical protein